MRVPGIFPWKGTLLLWCFFCIAKATPTGQSSVSRAVNESLSQLEGTKLSVPIGTLSGINILTGRGFDIPLRLHQIGAAKTELKSDLTEAGINQTKYSLYLTVTIEMTAILPAHSTDIVVSYDYPVSEIAQTTARPARAGRSDRNPY